MEKQSVVQIEQYRECIQVLSKSRNSLQQDLNVMKQDRDSLEKLNKQLLDQCGQQMFEIEELQKQIQKMNQKLIQQNNKKSLNNEEYHNCLQELDQLKIKQVQTVSKNDEVIKENQMLKSLLVEANLKNQELERKIEYMVDFSNYDECQKTIAQLNEKLQNANSILKLLQVKQKSKIPKVPKKEEKNTKETFSDCGGSGIKQSSSQEIVESHKLLKKRYQLSEERDIPKDRRQTEFLRNVHSFIESDVKANMDQNLIKSVQNQNQSESDVKKNQSLVKSVQNQNKLTKIFTSPSKSNQQTDHFQDFIHLNSYPILSTKETEMKVFDESNNIVNVISNTSQNSLLDNNSDESFYSLQEFNSKMENIGQIKVNQKTTISTYPSENVDEKINLTFHNKRFFEDLLIIGPDKKYFPLNRNDFNAKAETLYNFNKQSPYARDYRDISLFAFPFGINCNKLNLQDGSLNEIIFTNYQNDPLSPFLFQLKNNNISYNCVCIKYKDFVVIQKQNNGIDIYSVEKIICFLSPIPLIHLYKDIAVFILNRMKMERIGLYDEESLDYEKNLHKIDSDFLVKGMLEELEYILTSVQNKSIPDYEKTIQVYAHISRINEQINFKMPHQFEFQILDTLWALQILIPRIKLEHISALIIALLVEKSVVVFVDNPKTLSSSIISIQNLIAPLVWQCPIIFRVPESLIQILDSPSPIILGFQKDITFFDKSLIESEYKNILFLDVQNQCLYNSNNQFQKTANSLKHSMKIIFEDEALNLYQKSIDILMIVQNFINRYLSKIPKIVRYENQIKKILDIKHIYDCIILDSDFEQSFVESFTNTQMFSKFAEEYYDNLQTTDNQ